MEKPSSVAIPLFHRKARCLFFSGSVSSLNSPQDASLQTNIALRSLQARKKNEINKERNWDFMWFLMIPSAVNVNRHCNITSHQRHHHRLLTTTCRNKFWSIGPLELASASGLAAWKVEPRVNSPQDLLQIFQKSSKSHAFQSWWITLVHPDTEICLVSVSVVYMKSSTPTGWP